RPRSRLPPDRRGPTARARASRAASDRAACGSAGSRSPRRAPARGRVASRRPRRAHRRGGGALSREPARRRRGNASGSRLTAVALALAAGLAARRVSVFLVAAGAQVAGLALVGTIVLAAGQPVPSARQLAWAAFGGVAGILGLSCFYRALAVGTMGIVGPITATGAIVPVVYGVARGERPDALQAGGIALAVVGVVAASLEPLPEGGRRVGAGVGLALAAALSFGCSLVGLGRAAPGGVVWGTLTMRMAAVPLVLALVL